MSTTDTYNGSGGSGNRAGLLFVPLKKPFLNKIPTPEAAWTFLKSYDRYIREMEHRVRAQEGDGYEPEPLRFFFEPELVTFLENHVEEISLEDEEELSDPALRTWLEDIVALEDFRTLPEILASIRWVAAAGSTLDQQTLNFMRACYKVLERYSVVDRFSEKDIIKIVCERLPAPLRNATRDHFMLLRGAETKKVLKKFWLFLRKTAQAHDQVARYYSPAAAAGKPETSKKRGGGNDGNSGKSTGGGNSSATRVAALPQPQLLMPAKPNLTRKAVMLAIILVANARTLTPPEMRPRRARARRLALLRRPAQD